MTKDELDLKLIEHYEGKAIRKDLLHRIKKGTNVPTFVLEFLLARYCASDDPAEIAAGTEAVLATLQDNYVKPDESNAAQSKVATKGKHRFIDKVQVRYVEKERRHWASLENFNSKRIAVSEKFYRDNDRLLEGGIWAEVTIAYNEIEDDDYTFYLEELRPIQLTRFDFESYVEGRGGFTRDEWLDTVLRSVGLEPSKLSKRQKFHFLARLAPLVEPNYNFIELGPRSTGKSYFYSEFSPYSTLISGGQATKATLFYNNQRGRVGLVGFWDTVAFDEVAGIRIKDPDTIQIMKDFLANGRFSRGVEVIADASMAFVGNIDHSIQQVVYSTEHDLFMPLPKEFDLAVMDRFAFYLPGWEMPKTSSLYLTDHYGLITDYLAEAFHYLFSHSNRYEEVTKRIRLGKSVEGRDEKGIKKTVCAFLKMLHPGDTPGDAEFEEYVRYAIEGRRRVKEQMNKRKSDDEFAKINLSYFDTADSEVEVTCPESKDAEATLRPKRDTINIVGSGAPSEPTYETANPVTSTPTQTDPIETEAPGGTPTNNRVPLAELIRGGESGEVEFKSTLRVNLHTNEIDPKIELSCLKSIAAFLNTHGGHVVVGVDDNAVVLGVGADRFPNEDKMTLHLVNIVKARMGPQIMTYVHPRFEDGGDKRVMVIEVWKAPVPVFVKDGNTERFYIRTGPATTELPGSEIQSYLKQRVV